MKVTIKDVAHRANVSIATVSRVFNGYTDISEATKKRVMAIAQEMDYSPNMAARTLSSKSQKTIALILNELNISRKSTMPMEVLSGVYKYTESSNCEFVFYGTSDTKQKEKSFRQFCNEHNITGVVMQGLKVTDPYYKELSKTKIPTVVIDMEIDNNRVGSVSIDNEWAAKEAVDYLIEIGHQEIAMLNGSLEANVSIQREIGYRMSLQEHGIPCVEEYIQYANFNEETAYQTIKELIPNHPEITAIFSASDIMAIGALRAANDLGLKVPEDLSIIGFDDIVLTNYIQPKLSSVAQDMEKIGYKAAELLDELISNKETLANHLFVEHELIIRDSVAPKK